MTSLEIPAIQFDPDNPSPKRLLIVPNIKVFWDDEQPNWTEERIREVMSWTDLDFGDTFYDRLIVASPDVSAEQYRNRSFQEAWEKWANHMSYELWLKWRVTHILPYAPCDETDEFGMLDADWHGSCTFYPKEFFDEFFDNQSHHEAWKDIMYDVFGLSLSHNWYGTDVLDRTLIEHCEQGDTVVSTSLGCDGNDSIAEIYILERVDGELVARAFMVPRAFDPSGHLP